MPACSWPLRPEWPRARAHGPAGHACLAGLAPHFSPWIVSLPSVYPNLAASARLPAAPGGSAWQLPVAAWAAWGFAAGGGDPDIGFIPPLLRRRLSPLARAALAVAHACCGDVQGLPMVYASRHGELARTVEMLDGMAGGEAPSPTTFSLSVLNAAAGVFSIARGDMAPATALAAGAETFGFGLLEAWLRFSADPARPLLYVYADAPAPPPLPACAGDPSGVVALALRLQAGAPQTLYTEFRATASNAAQSPQAAACLAALGGAGCGAWQDERRIWTWRLQAGAPA